MDKYWLSGDPPIPISLRRSTRARRLSLRISRSDGTVTLTLPRGTPLAEGLTFANDRAGWIRRHLTEIWSALPAPASLGFGTEIPLRGRQVTLVSGPVRRPLSAHGLLILPGNEDRIAARLRAFLRLEARAALAAAADRHSATLGRRYGRLTLRDTRGRWGSCSSRGDLMFSWRLIMAPDSVLDYVVAHEVAHLEEMNHAPAFWRLVARLCPDYDDSRLWLKAHGSSLLAIPLAD